MRLAEHLNYGLFALSDLNITIAVVAVLDFSFIYFSDRPDSPVVYQYHEIQRGWRR
jgi:hypothetical protein